MMMMMMMMNMMIVDDIALDSPCPWWRVNWVFVLNSAQQKSLQNA